ncbi:Ig-like domain-containing protein, partial [Okeania sp.]|uniref:Ig-like domain-containing protein n=1 Tax=Okeania sp. TaxID=3100323 RepID=UPI002B4AECCE
MTDNIELLNIMSTFGQEQVNAVPSIFFQGQVEVEPLMAVGIIKKALIEVQHNLADFADSATFETDMLTVFSESANVDLGRTIIESLVRGEDLPPINVVSVEQMNGAAGGFESLTGEVYLADSLINQGSLKVANVLVEEFGHLVDWELNRIDTPGDEGEWFAALVRGDVLSSEDVRRLQQENDIVRIIDERVEVEARDISLSSLNSRPVANNDEVETNEDTAIGINKRKLLANDTDLDRDKLTITDFVDNTNNGTLLETDDSFIYTPDENFSGTETFTYTVTDTSGSTSTANVTINVTPVADTPNLEISNNSVSGKQDEDISLGITSSLVDTDNSETLSINISGVPDGATLSNGTVQDDGSWVLTVEELDGLTLIPSTAEQTEILTFDLTVTATSTETANSEIATISDVITVEVIPFSRPPEVEEDKTIALYEDTTIRLDIPVPTDPDGDKLTITVKSIPDPELGKIIYSRNNTAVAISQQLTTDQLTHLRFVPVKNANGDAGTFSYTVNDENHTATQFISFDITPVNEPPVARNDGPVFTNLGNVLTIDLLANDSDVDGDELSVNTLSNHEHGILKNLGTQVQYTAVSGTGTDTFEYTVTDGSEEATATVTVNIEDVTGNASVEGGEFNDNFDGGDGDDTLAGLAGDDTLAGN